MVSYKALNTTFKGRILNRLQALGQRHGLKAGATVEQIHLDLSQTFWQRHRENARLIAECPFIYITDCGRHFIISFYLAQGINKSGLVLIEQYRAFRRIILISLIHMKRSNARASLERVPTYFGHACRNVQRGKADTACKGVGHYTIKFLWQSYGFKAGAAFEGIAV